MKTEFSACPPPFKIERIGEHSAKVSFAENAVEIKTETGSIQTARHGPVK